MKRNKTKSWDSIEDVSQTLATSGSNPGRDVERQELQHLINKAIVSLPEKQRAIFILRYYEGLSHKDIADILGRSEGAIKAGYFHAVKKLQTELATYERWVT